jgi:hypothetical protein
LANTGTTKDYSQYEKEKKSRRKKLLGFLFLFFVVFIAGMFVGDRYMDSIRGTVSRTARTPIEGVRDILDNASSFASKEEIKSAVDGCDDLNDDQKESLKEEIDKAYAAREKSSKPEVEYLWADAHKLFEDARKQHKPAGSDMRSVVEKLNEAAEAARGK